MRHVILATLTATLLGVTATASAGPPSSVDVQVMTQNQYVGANLFPLIPAIQSGNPDVVNSALVSVISTISANRTVDRVNALSSEILARKPDLVGIQEAWLIWCEPIGAPPCTNPEFRGAWGDHLAQTQFLLAGEYTQAAYIENFEFGYPFRDSQGNEGFAYVLDRDAVFVRNGIPYSLPVPGADYPCDVPFTSGSSCTFNVNTPLDFNGDGTADAYILHGFMVVDATIGGKPYRFVNTHLENGYVDGFPGVIQSAQALQIVQAAAGTPDGRRLILVGDMNSDPSDAVDPMSQIPATPYMLFAGAGLFDVWLHRPGDVAGLTCCQAEDLVNRTTMLTRRIDLIFTREEPRKVKDARLIGEVAADRLGPPGRSLWPTDHASVAAGIGF
ncbi:MAG: endonuclease/exonuclease/phosphatase family protein [Steroidobacteraceae bacterium]|jgi:hypothetical protein|nr:endonuclease/exonuclease/phosphatase family protein [Steroidobacteraceae bacterium]